MENAGFLPALGQARRMSPFTRYAFSALIGIYGIYQLTQNHPVPGVIAILLAAFIFWISRRR
jgi:hypothetical protein